MQNVGQFGQGTANAHHHPSTHQFVPSEPSPNGGSTSTSTLRQFRKRDVEKNIHHLDELPSSQHHQSKLMSESHVARVAPQNHYPPTNDPFRFASTSNQQQQQHQFQQNFISNSQTKYSDIITDSTNNHSNSITTSVIQKPKNKEYNSMEMCNISSPSSQQHLNNNSNNQHYSSENGQYLHKDPNQNYAAMFKPSESQFFQKEHHHQYQAHHLHHQQMVHHSIRSKFPTTTIMNQNHLIRKYNNPSEPSDNPFLNKLSKIHPSMARSIISDHHLQQDSQSNYGASNMDQRMMYQSQQNHRYFAGPLHSPNPYTTNYNYPMNSAYPPNYSNPSCSYPRSSQIASPLNSRYNSIERSLSPARRGVYPPESINMSPHINYHANLHQKMPSGNFPSQFRPGPEYAQHYQHRRMPQECFVPSGQYIQAENHQIHNPEMNASIAENTISPSDSLKKFIENWADEETAVEINQIDGGVNLRDKLKDDAPPGTVYMINATDVQYFENNGIPIVTSENGGLQVTSENYQYLLKNGLVDNGGMVRIIEANKEITIDANGNQERVVNLQIMETPSSSVKSDCMLANNNNNKLSCKEAEEEEEEEAENRSRAIIHQNVVLTAGISQQIADEIPLHTDNLTNNNNNNKIKELVDKNCSPINLDHLDDDNLEDLTSENLKHSTSEENFNELTDELSQDSGDGDKSPNSKSMPIIDFFDLNASRNIGESTNSSELETERLSENCSNSHEQDLQSTYLKELSNNDECIDEPHSLEVTTISSEKRKRIFSVDDIMHNIGNSSKSNLLALVVCDGKMILDFLEKEIAFSSLEHLTSCEIIKSPDFNKTAKNKADIGVNTEEYLSKFEEKCIFPNILKVHGSSAIVEVSGELIEITLNINDDGKKVINVKSLSDPSAVIDFNKNCENSESIENTIDSSDNLKKDIPVNGTETIIEDSLKSILPEMEIPKSPSIVQNSHKTEVKMEFKAEEVNLTSNLEDNGDTDEEKSNDNHQISCEIQSEESIDENNINDSIISKFEINNDCSTQQTLSAIDEDLISDTGYHLCSASEEKIENSDNTDDLIIQDNVEILSSNLINDSANENDQISTNIEEDVAKETQAITESQIKEDDTRIEDQNSSNVVEEINLAPEENQLIAEAIDLDHVAENILLQDINEEFILEDQVFIEDSLVHEEVIVTDPFDGIDDDDLNEENSEIPLELVTTSEILDITSKITEIEILSPTSTNYIEDLSTSSSSSSTVINCTIEKHVIKSNNNTDISDCTPTTAVVTKAAKKQYESDHKVQHDLVSSSKKEDNIIIPSSNNKNRNKTNIKKIRRDKLMMNNKLHHREEKDAIINQKPKNNNEPDEEFVDFKELLRARKLKKLKKLEAEETKVKNEKKSIKHHHHHHEVEIKIKAKKRICNLKNKEVINKNSLKIEKITKEEANINKIPEEKNSVVEKSAAIILISNNNNNNSEEHPSSTSNNKSITEKENSLSIHIEELYPKDPRKKSKVFSNNSETVEIVAENPGKKKISLADYVSRKRKATTTNSSNSENEIDQKKLKKEPPESNNNINKIDVINKITPVSIIHSCDWEDSNSPILLNEEIAEEECLIEDICGLNKINYKKPVIDLNELLPINNNNNNIENKADAIVDKALQEYKEKVDLKLNTLNIQIPKLKRRQSFEILEEKSPPDIVKKFMNNELLSESEFKQIQNIISYKKRTMMEIQKIKNPIIINNNNNNLKKVNAKRKSFPNNISDNNNDDSDDDDNDDDDDCNSVKSYQSYKNVNYSVINRLGEDGLPKIIFKRNAKIINNNMNKEPVVELVKLNLKELEKVKKKYNITIKELL